MTSTSSPKPTTTPQRESLGRKKRPGAVVGFVGFVWFGLACLVWFGLFGLVWFAWFGLVWFGRGGGAVFFFEVFFSSHGRGVR